MMLSLHATDDGAYPTRRRRSSMKRRLVTVSAGLGFLVASFAGVLLLLPGEGTAQIAADVAQMQSQRPLPGRHIEGRLAFLRTELKITDAQAPAWDRVAAILRDRAVRMDAAIAAVRQARGDGTQPDLLTQMEARIRSGEARIESDRAFLAAFRPLYAALSDEQKTTADELFARRHEHRRGQ
jgi:hypothetical protein